MVSADVTSDDNVAKGKREAPMAEPSTEYLPPRLEAPYATFQPITVGNNGPQTSYFRQPAFTNQQTPFSQQPSFGGQSPFNEPLTGSPAPAPAYEYSRFAGVLPLQTVDNNDLGNGINQEPYNNNPGPPYYNNIYGVSGAYTEGNSYGGANSYGSFIKYGEGNIRTNYGSYNGAGQSLNVYSGNQFGNNGGSYDQYSTIKNSHFGNSGANFDQNSFIGNQANKYPSSALLRSNQQPSYAAGVKGLRHYTSQPVSSLNTSPLKNSRPIALQPAHQQRKPPTFLQDTKNPNFRPSFLLGSQVLSSTPDYNQPTLNSLGTTNQYIPPTQSIPEHLIAQPIPQQYGQQPFVGQYIQSLQPEQYSAPQSLGELPLTQKEYLPASAPDFVNSYQAAGQSGLALPETVIYTRTSPYTERYTQTK